MSFSFSCSLYGSSASIFSHYPQHPPLSLQPSAFPPSLIPLIFSVVFLVPGSFPPIWQLQIQHLLYSIPTIPLLHMFKPTQSFLSDFVNHRLNLTCPSDIQMSSPVTPKQNLSIFSSATSRSAFCPFACATVSKPGIIEGLTTVF